MFSIVYVALPVGLERESFPNSIFFRFEEFCNMLAVRFYFFWMGWRFRFGRRVWFWVEVNPLL
jgi:hypothetical protein